MDGNQFSKRSLAIALGLVFAGVGASAENNRLPDVTQAPVNDRFEVTLQTVGQYSLSATNPFDFPTDMVFDNSGRAFITEYGGLIKTYNPGSPAAATTYFDRTAAGNNLAYRQGDAGVTSLVLHPDFLNQGAAGYGKFYTVEPELDEIEAQQLQGQTQNAPDFWPAYDDRRSGAGPGSRQENGQDPYRVHHSVVYEYTATDPTAGTFQGTQREVMRMWQPAFGHNVDDLAFGDDGNLYISTGDGQNSLPHIYNSSLFFNDEDMDINGENENQDDDWGDFRDTQRNLYGKILRINPLIGNAPANATLSANGQYYIPNDNPFDATDTGTAGDKLEAYAYGMRNPYRISFDQATGDLWMTITGQNDIEAAYNVSKGDNIGWPFTEGTFVYDDINQEASTTQNMDSSILTPEFQYDHQDGETGIGGFVYRGSLIPELDGMYIFGDYQGVEFSNDPDNAPNLARLFFGDPDEDAPTSTSGDQNFFDMTLSEISEALPHRIIGFAQDADGEIYILGHYIPTDDQGNPILIDGREAPAYGVIMKLVPEPASLLLLAGGVSLMLCRRRRS